MKCRNVSDWSHEFGPETLVCRFALSGPYVRRGGVIIFIWIRVLGVRDRRLPLELETFNYVGIVIWSFIGVCGAPEWNAKRPDGRTSQNVREKGAWRRRQEQSVRRRMRRSKFVRGDRNCREEKKKRYVRFSTFRVLFSDK